MSERSRIGQSKEAGPVSLQMSRGTNVLWERSQFLPAEESVDLLLVASKQDDESHVRKNVLFTVFPILLSLCEGCPVSCACMGLDRGWVWTGDTL